MEIDVLYAPALSVECLELSNMALLLVVLLLLLLALELILILPYTIRDIRK